MKGGVYRMLTLRAQENVEDSRWETAVRCIKKYEGWHGPEHYPYYPKQNIIQSLSFYCINN